MREGSVRGRVAGWVLVAFVALAGCDALPAVQTGAQQGVKKKPDVNGEPLALLPASPVAYLRWDGAAIRASAHWEALHAAITEQAGGWLKQAERELGFDPIEHADMVAVALYAPPGASNTARADESRAWPLVMARGHVDTAAVLDAARARAPAEDPLATMQEEGYTISRTRRRAYLVIGADAVMIFDPALTRRVVHVLSGEEPASASADARFDDLWKQADGRQGDVLVAADLSALRALGAAPETSAISIAALDTLVAWASAPGDVELAAVGVARDEFGAQRLEEALDDERRRGLSALGGWPFSLSRLFQQGVTVVHESRAVRVRIRARKVEVERLISAISLAASLGR